MSARRAQSVPVLLLVLASALGCDGTESDSEGDDAVPAGSRQAGQSLESSRGSGFDRIVQHTAALVEGTVSDVRYEYDEWNGPETVVSLEGVSTLFGAASAVALSVRLRGGPLPDGSFLRVVHMPTFVRDARYVLFLTNQNWNLSPLVRHLALRVETVGGEEVLVNDDGAPVVDFDDPDRGIRFSETELFEAPRSLAEALAPRRLRDEGAAAAVGGVTRAVLVSRLDARAKALAVGRSGPPRLIRSKPYPWNKIPTDPDVGGAR